MGYNVNNIGNLKNTILDSQKVGALEIMSIFFNGEFKNTLKEIANNEQYITKFKNSFDILTKLML